MNLTEARTLAETSIKIHMTRDPAGFNWTRYVKKFKKCGHYDIKKHEICLSPRYVELNPRKFVRNTILHEIAHALTPGEGHTNKWRTTFLLIGGNGQRQANKNTITK